MLRKFSLSDLMGVRCWDAFFSGFLVQELCRHCNFIHLSSVKITEYLTAESEGFIGIAKYICGCIKIVELYKIKIRQIPVPGTHQLDSKCPC